LTKRWLPISRVPPLLVRLILRGDCPRSYCQTTRTSVSRPDSAPHGFTSARWLVPCLVAGIARLSEPSSVKFRDLDSPLCEPDEYLSVR